MDTIQTFEKEIIELSKIKSQKEIALLYNSTQPKISNILRKNKIINKKSRLNMSHLALNIDYFKEINSNDKAYWLGFICADGNIKKTNNKVSLISKDLEVIVGFKEAIGAENKISKREIFDKRTNKTYTGYSIQIGNEIFTQHLINLGITNNKTNVLEFPNIEEKYYSYFIAGLFDGDGSISLKGINKNRLVINLISTNEMLLYIKEYILNKLNIKPKYCCDVSKNKQNVWKMYLYSDAHRFLKFIYCDANFKYYLKRKYNIFLKNINYRNNIRHLKKVIQCDKNMNIIKIWNTIREASIEMNCHENTLNYNIKKERLFKNYHWKHENE